MTGPTAASQKQEPREPGRPDRAERRLVLPALLLAAGLLVLPNLGNQFLWQDEAQTALLAATVVDRGLPYGTDGRNFFSQELGAEYGEGHLWRWHTWLPFYAVAAVFAVLGESTFAARLPFALFGMGTIPLLFVFAKGLWKDRYVALSSSLMLLACVPFLLLSRQARYYAAAACFSLLGLEAYRRMGEDRRYATLWFFVSATLLFHTQYVYCATLLISVALHTAAFDRERWRKTLLGCGAVAVVNLPWVLWLSGMRYTERYGDSFLDPSRALDPLVAYAGQLLEHVFPWFLPAAAVLAAIVGAARGLPVIRRDREWWSAFALPTAFVVVTAIVLSLTAPAPFFRYLAPVIPPLLAVAGLVVRAAHRCIHPLAGAGVLLAFLWAQPARDFLHELTHDYDGPIERIVGFLEENADPDDTVAITYGDLPLKFYTDLRIIGGLTGEDLAAAKDARWVILRRNAISRKDLAVRQYLVKNLQPERYRPIPLGFPDIRFENRESPDEHRYRTAEEGPELVILRRID